VQALHPQTLSGGRLCRPCTPKHFQEGACAGLAPPNTFIQEGACAGLAPPNTFRRAPVQASPPGRLHALGFRLSPGLSGDVAAAAAGAATADPERQPPNGMQVHSEQGPMWVWECVCVGGGSDDALCTTHTCQRAPLCRTGKICLAKAHGERGSLCMTNM
jgi:hypothetical protein